MNIDPRGLSIKRWCDQMVQELRQFGAIPTLLDEQQWREWGQQLLLFPGLQATPRPHGFQTFEEWAMAFNLAVPL